MLLQPVVLTGVAQFTGVGGTITYASAAIYPIQETIKANQVFEYEPIKDPSGFDLAWSARNNCYDIDLGMKLMDSTGYGSSPSGGSVANAISGALFPAPISTITLAGFGGADSADIPWLNSIYEYRPVKHQMRRDDVEGSLVCQRRPTRTHRHYPEFLA